MATNPFNAALLQQLIAANGSNSGLFTSPAASAYPAALGINNAVVSAMPASLQASFLGGGNPQFRGTVPNLATIAGNTPFVPRRHTAFDNATNIPTAAGEGSGAPRMMPYMAYAPPGTVAPTAGAAAGAASTANTAPVPGSAAWRMQQPNTDRAMTALANQYGNAQNQLSANVAGVDPMTGQPTSAGSSAPGATAPSQSQIAAAALQGVQGLSPVTPNPAGLQSPPSLMDLLSGIGNLAGRAFGTSDTPANWQQRLQQQLMGPPMLGGLAANPSALQNVDLSSLIANIPQLR